MTAIKPWSQRRSFIGIEEWTALVNERIALLKTHPEAELREMEKEFSYNWTALIEKWSAMDDIKETAARQSGNTISRVSFMDSVRKFLVAQELMIGYWQSGNYVNRKGQSGCAALFYGAGI